MTYPIYRVESFCRKTRRTLAVHAEGLTMRAASRLAQVLRDGDSEHEDKRGYSIGTMPLHRQAELLAASEAMREAKRAA